MNHIALPRAQRGVTLIIGLIMLVMITLIVTSAFMLSHTNLKSVGNMQFRDESIAAANVAIEQVLASPFYVSPAAESINVDISKNGKPYTVEFMAPTCIRATQLGGTTAVGGGSSATLGLPSGAPPTYMTVWDFDATVTDSASGAFVRVRQGVHVLLTQAQYNAVCL